MKLEKSTGPTPHTGVLLFLMRATLMLILLGVLLALCVNAIPTDTDIEVFEEWLKLNGGDSSAVSFKFHAGTIFV